MCLQGTTVLAVMQVRASPKAAAVPHPFAEPSPFAFDAKQLTHDLRLDPTRTEAIAGRLIKRGDQPTFNIGQDIEVRILEIDVVFRDHHQGPFDQWTLEGFKRARTDQLQQHRLELFVSEFVMRPQDVDHFGHDHWVQYQTKLANLATFEQGFGKLGPFCDVLGDKP